MTEPSTAKRKAGGYTKHGGPHSKPKDDPDLRHFACSAPWRATPKPKHAVCPPHEMVLEDEESGAHVCIHCDFVLY